MNKITAMALSALTLAAFAIGTSEFVIMGLLVDIAQELQVTISKAGLLITAYALGVVIGGPVVAVLTTRLPRKLTLIVLVSVFTLGNVLCALAPNYTTLLLARIVTATCHGTFFGIATVVAVQLVKTDYRARAVAWVFLGTTLANMLGVPLGTAEGFHFGWRSTFWTVAAIGVIAIIALSIFVPQKLRNDNSSPWDEFRTLKRPLVFIPLALSMLLNGGLFVVYTFIAPLLMNVTSMSEHGVTLVLLILGIGLPIGTLIGGKLGDLNLKKSLIGLFAALILILVGMYWFIPYKVSGVIFLFLWSTIIFTIAPMLQLMVVNNADEAPNLASTFNQSAFNLGNAIGSSLGSLLLLHHIQLRDLPLASIVFMAIALALVFVYIKMEKKLIIMKNEMQAALKRKARLKKITWGTIVALLALLTLGVIYFYNSTIYGSWEKEEKPYSSNVINIFDDKISIQKVDAKPNSLNKYFTVIHDKNRHAFACAHYDQQQENFVCIPFIMNTDEIEPGVELEDITAGSIPEMTAYLKIEPSNHLLFQRLHMKARPIDTVCKDDDITPCNYKYMPTYKKYIF